MPNTTWRHHTTAAILTLLLATSCTTPAAPTPTPSPTNTQAPYTLPAPTSTTTAPPTPQPTETFNPDQQAAAETVLEWVRLWDAVQADLEAPTDDFAYIMTGRTQSILMAQLASDREAGIIGVGTSRTYIMGAESAQPEPEGKSVYVSFCTDTSQYDLVDSATGESILDANRGYFVDWHMKVLYNEKADRWLISDYTSEKAKSCGN